MNWLFLRLRSLEFRFAVMLSTVLCISTALGLTGVSFHRQLVSTTEATGHIATNLDDFAAADTQLRVLRMRLMDVNRRFDGYDGNREADWAAMEQLLAAQLAQRQAGALALTPRGQDVEVRLRRPSNASSAKPGRSCGTRGPIPGRCKPRFPVPALAALGGILAGRYAPDDAAGTDPAHA